MKDDNMTTHEPGSDARLSNDARAGITAAMRARTTSAEREEAATAAAPPVEDPGIDHGDHPSG
jgi:hypothetical protein